MNIPGNLKRGNDLTRAETEVTFVIGGGVSRAGEILLEYVQKYYNASNTKLMLATLENDAGIYGACKLILG